MAYKKFTLPKGVAIYPWLNKADSKFDEPTYKCGLAVPEEQAQPLIEKLQDTFDVFYQEECEKAGKKKMKTEDMPWEEDENGNVVFKTKLNQFGKSKVTGEEWENKIAFFDAAGQPLSVVPKIGGGSILKISVEARPWNVSGKLGLKLNIKAIMVIEPKDQVSTKSASDFGFEAEEGGYTYDPESFDDYEVDSAGDY